MQTTLPSLSAISPFDQPHSVAVSSSAILSQLDARLYTWGIRSTGVTRLGTGGAGMDRQMFVLVFLELDTLNQPKLSKYTYIYIYIHIPESWKHGKQPFCFMQKSLPKWSFSAILKTSQHHVPQRCKKLLQNSRRPRRFAGPRSVVLELTGVDQKFHESNWVDF